MKHVLAVFVFIFFFMSNAVSASKNCDGTLTGYTLSKPLSIREIERRETLLIRAMRKTDPSIPDLPFGYQNYAWNLFKVRIKPKDKVVFFESSAHSWKNSAGESGYALFRSGCVIEQFLGAYN